MDTTIRQFQEQVRDILNQDAWFDEHGISWLCENTLDIEYEIKKNLGQTGLVAVVTTPNLTYQGEHKSVESKKNYEKTFDGPWELRDGGQSTTIYLSENPYDSPSTITLTIDENDSEGQKQYVLEYSARSDAWIYEESTTRPRPRTLRYTLYTDVLRGLVLEYYLRRSNTTTRNTWIFPTGFRGYAPETYTVTDDAGRQVVLQVAPSYVPDEEDPTVQVLKIEFRLSGGALDETLTFEVGDIATVEDEGVWNYSSTTDGKEISAQVKFALDKGVIASLGNPTSVEVSVKKGNMIGKPFDHKLSWVKVNSNMVSDTGFAPSLSVPWSMEMMVHTSNNSEMYPILSTGDEFRIRFVSNSNQLQGTYGNRTVTNNFGCFRDATGQMRAWNGANPAVYRSINPIKVGFSLNSSTTAASRIYNQGYFGDNCWSTPNGTNNAITVTDGFTLLLLGTDTGPYSDRKFEGKFYYSKIYAGGQLTRDMYPVLANGGIRIYDSVTGAYLEDIINTLTPDAGTNYEVDEDWETVTTDSSVVDFTEYVSHINKGFDTEISLQIIENPTVNRGKPDKDKIATALDVGHRAVYTLSGYDTEHYNDFNFTTIRQSTVAGAGNKLLQVEAKFKSTPVL